MRIELTQVWRDKVVLEDIRAEVKRQALHGWRPWEYRLPPDLLWPMVSEISEGMVEQWSPTLDGAGVQLGEENEVAIRFVLRDMQTSPVMVRSMPYRGGRQGDTQADLVVRRGHPL